MAFRFLSLLLFLTATLTAQQSTNEQVLARAELGRKTIEIGDQIWLEVNVSAPPGTEVLGLPAGYLATLDAIEVREEKALNVVAETPELLLQQRFLITSFDSGFVNVPPLPIAFRSAGGRLDTAYTNDLLLTVNTIPVTDDAELQPIKGIIEEPRNLLDFWWLFLLLALGAAAYGFVQYRKRQTRVAPPPPPPPPAHELALGALSTLEGEQLWQRGQTKEYYSELTRILREYLEGRFHVPALEMTTRQTTDALDRRTDFDSTRVQELSKLLQLSDLVKFAQARPAAELHPESLNRVKSFVEATIPVAVDPETESTPPAVSPAPSPAVASTTTSGLTGGSPATAQTEEE